MFKRKKKESIAPAQPIVQAPEPQKSDLTPMFKPHTIRKMIDRGQIASIRIGRNIRISPAEIEHIATHGAPRVAHVAISSGREQEKKAG